jgi:hypothetical protein
LRASELKVAGIDPDGIKVGDRLSFEAASLRDGRTKVSNVRIAWGGEMAGAQRRGTNWTPEEDRRLFDLIETGKSWVFISAKLKRPAKTIHDRLSYLRRQSKKADLEKKLI